MLTKEQINGLLRHALSTGAGLIGGAWVAQFFTPEVLDALAALIGALAAGALSVKAKAPTP